MDALTKFQKKVWAALPLSPGHKHIDAIVRIVYGDYAGPKKARGRNVAVSKALRKMERLGKVGWRSFEYNRSVKYWFKKHPKWD